MDPITIALGLAKFAPSLIQYFTGSDKAGTVAQKVVEIAQTVTGAPTPDGALAAIQADPQKAMEFQLAVQAADADLTKAFLADVQDARRRDIELAKLGKRNVRADVMVALDVVGLLSCLIVLCFYRDKIPGEAVGLISTIASFFGLSLRDAHQFEFGSSRSSQVKDATISSLTK